MAKSTSDSKKKEPIDVDRLLVVERDRFRLALYDLPKAGGATYDLKKVYTVAVGAKGYRTPRGMYRINSRLKDPIWYMPDSEWVPPELRGKEVPGGSVANPLKARWLGVTDPLVGVGIHGTADETSLGTAASHGCIRMAVDEVIELYPKVPLGTPIYIV